ncbi:polysaccharide deacetylase family protein [Vallicoccus soli]|uniref:Polysaccharide deacetylase family protein n=1 Tax=Vallicoccus soli TaxID=2339232 RepID=A0A3A3Z3Y5_9ACTN|nr:polysaccharide deacetylase family protein [Vallicoccus soli]RJK95257.1 polysaccharide deacetylase family protein [Vallicoccus soli]
MAPYRLLRSAVLPTAVAAVAALLTSAPAMPAAAAAPTVTVQGPQYDSPGATVPVVVTVTDPPSGYAVALTASADRGARTVCTGATWANPVRGTVSRRCYVTLPRTRGSHVLAGRAVLTRSGSPTVTVTGRGPRALRAEGVVTDGLTLAAAQAVEGCGNATQHVQLTFDDGGSASSIRSILGTLRRNGVRGRFFPTGTWARANPGLMREVRAGGHLLANHTDDHPALSALGDAAVAAQLRRGVAATTRPKLLRPPYGAGALSARVVRIAAEQGYAVCRWTSDTYDWEGASGRVLAERVRYGDARTPPVQRGGVVLMHGTGRHTADGLQGIIDAVRAKGLSLEPLRP